MVSMSFDFVTIEIRGIFLSFHDLGGMESVHTNDANFYR
jgi:hypothetical protein